MTLAFFVFDTIPAYDRRTDGRTDGHVALAKTRASICAYALSVDTKVDDLG